MDWLWQWLITHTMEWALPIVVGFIVGVWKWREGKLVTPALYGLVAFTCVWFIVAQIQRDRRVQSMIGLEETTPTVVESSIRNWLHGTPYSVKKEASYSDWYFAFTVQANPNRPFTIGQFQTGGLVALHYFHG